MSFRQRHRGIALLWTAVLLVVLTGFCALSVDVARLQMVRTELQSATIAAARAGAAGLATSQATALANAKAVATKNKYDTNKALNLSNSEVTFITKDSKSGVRVVVSRQVPLILAGIFDKGYGTVSASAAAVMGTQQSTAHYALAAHDTVQISGATNIGGYDSSKGSRSGSNSTYGDVAAGGTGKVSGAINIDGTFYYGNSYTKSGAGSVDFEQPLPEPIPDEIPSLPSTYTSLGNYKQSGASNITLDGGNYYATSFKISGATTIHVTGQINLYVDGPIDISGAFSASGGRPQDIKIFVLDSSDVQISGASNLSAVIYAPLSDIRFSGAKNYYGSVIGNNIRISGGTNFYYDTSLGGSGGQGTPSITLVE